MNPGNTESFEAFMERALHDPIRGYYARNIRDIGARGDFTTAPQLSEAPGKAIASWLSTTLPALRTSNVIEIGPGLGTLARQVRSNLPLGSRLRTKFHLVESSRHLRERQMQTLGRKVYHHATIHEALKACSGVAAIYSNELVDAFPVRLFEKVDGAWLEIALDHSAGQTTEIFMPYATLPKSGAFHPDLPDGQRVEVHESYRVWLESWLPDWKRGEMLTIDYGYAADHTPPHKGTLRAYFLHQRTEGSEIYQNPGLRDLTADVNFEDLMEWSRPWLIPESLVTLSEFMRDFVSPSDSQVITAAEHFMVLKQRPVS